MKIVKFPFDLRNVTVAISEPLWIVAFRSFRHRRNIYLLDTFYCAYSPPEDENYLPRPRVSCICTFICCRKVTSKEVLDDEDC